MCCVAALNKLRLAIMAMMAMMAMMTMITVTMKILDDYEN
jgi:hypothetical protein